MRGIANADSESEYTEAVNRLKDHPHWQSNQRMQKWFDKQWLSVAHRWVKALQERNYGMRITTTNGLERKHQEFKRGYLSHYSEGSLCAMISTLVSNFLPDSYRRYISYNIQSLDFCRKYSASVPNFLHNKPRMLVEHCIKRIPPEVQSIPEENVQKIAENVYAVHSVDSNNIYQVSVSDTEPTCTCVDYTRHHLPCKHMLALMISIPECSWDKLPDNYKTCPHFNVDQHILQQCINSIPGSPNTSLQNTTLPEVHIYLNQDTPQEKRPKNQDQQPPKESNKPIHLLLQSALGGLKDIQSDLYLINDSSDLQEISQKIAELKSFTTSKTQKDSGLPLTSKEKDTKPSLKRKSGTLPLRKKYRKLKEKHCVQFTEEDDIIIIDGTYDAPRSVQDNHEHGNRTTTLAIDVNTLWKIKPSDYLVAKIGNNKITDTSIGFLKTTLSDEIIDAYLHLLTETKKNKKLFTINSAVATAIFQGTIENFHGYMKQVELSTYDMILAAVNENNSHWTLIVVYPSEKTLLYINPLGELKRNVHDIGENWREFINGRVRRGVTEMSADGWKVETAKHTKQYDSNSCGVYVLKFAELVISDMPLIFSCRPDNLYQIRQGIGNQILQATEELFEYCRACSLHREARQNENWIMCETCDKFFHGGCVSNSRCSMCISFDQHNLHLELNLRKDPPKKKKRSSFLYSDLRGRYGHSNTEEAAKDKDRDLGCSRKSRPMRKINYSKYKESINTTEVDSIETSEEVMNWVCKGTGAKSLQCQNIVKLLCDITPDNSLDIVKGETYVDTQKLSILFEDHVKAGLCNIINQSNGSTEYYEPHWRHLRWIKNESLSHQLEMRMNKSGIEERLDMFGKKGLKELKALVLEEFGIFKPKSKLRIGYTPGYYLTVKNCQIDELRRKLEDEMGQNMNLGVQYFRDILFVEAEIIIASIVLNSTVQEADKKLYPLKSSL